MYYIYSFEKPVLIEISKDNKIRMNCQATERSQVALWTGEQYHCIITTFLMVNLFLMPFVAWDILVPSTLHEFYKSTTNITENLQDTTAYLQ